MFINDNFWKKIFLNFYLFIFRERGREREGVKHHCVVASHTTSTGDLACNPGTCPEWELNQWPFGSQHSIHWPTPVRAEQSFMTSVCSDFEYIFFFNYFKKQVTDTIPHSYREFSSRLLFFSFSLVYVWMMTKRSNSHSLRYMWFIALTYKVNSRILCWKVLIVFWLCNRNQFLQCLCGAHFLFDFENLHIEVNFLIPHLHVCHLGFPALIK